MTEKYCRLCLNTVDNNFQKIEAARDLLDKLFWDMNLDVSQEDVICYDCMKNLQVYSNFKSAYVLTKDTILPLSDFKDQEWSDPKGFNNPNNSIVSMDFQKKCCFCTRATKKELLSLNESKEHMFLMDTIHKYIPEWNLNNTEEFLTCQTCLDSLQNLSSFLTNYFVVEEKIKRYIEIEGTDDNGQIDLNAVKRFEFKPTPKYEPDQDNSIKVEEENCQIKEDVTVKDEIKDEETMDDPDLIKPEELDGILKQNSDLDVSKMPSVLTYKCEICTYESKYKNFLKRHMLIHKSPYKCNMCKYETKNKGHLQGHILIHKSPSEIEMHRCETCTYETKHKRCLTQHVASYHSGPSEATMYKCDTCPYETSQKRNLQDHTLVHKNPSEITMYKCDLCTYETKRRQHINLHMLTHKNPSEIKMYRCQICTHETKRKSTLVRHMLTHKSRSELTMHQCEQCNNRTKHEDCVNWHTTHKNVSELTRYKCEICTYETKWKGTLQRHMLTHKSASEITMYKCEACTFETKYKSALIKHFGIHKTI